jgi:hypothetical protein
MNTKSVANLIPYVCIFAFVSFYSVIGSAQLCAPVSTGLVSWWPAEGNADDIEGTNNGKEEQKPPAGTPVPLYHPATHYYPTAVGRWPRACRVPPQAPGPGLLDVCKAATEAPV